MSYVRFLTKTRNDDVRIHERKVCGHFNTFSVLFPRAVSVNGNKRH